MKKQNSLSKKCQQLENAGDLSARPGSLLWAIAVKLELQSALEDLKFAISQIKAYQNLLLKHGSVFLELLDSKGEHFWYYEDFCKEKKPYGLGCRRELIEKAIALKLEMDGEFEKLIEYLDDIAGRSDHLTVEKLIEQKGFYPVGDNKEHEANMYCRIVDGNPQFLMHSRISDSVKKMEF